MLDFAIKHQDALNLKSMKTLNDLHFKYVYGAYSDLNKKIETDTWNKLQYVSIDPKTGEVIGYISASIDRICHYAHSLVAINYTKKPNIIFSKDFVTFIKQLFEVYKFNKVQWSVLINNPAEKMYDRFIEKHNGRIVGIYKEETYTFDHELCDKKLYEILRKDYIK